jgi:hypothetical protein
LTERPPTYRPPPQDDADLQALIRRFTGDYCTLASATQSETVRGVGAPASGSGGRGAGGRQQVQSSPVTTLFFPARSPLPINPAAQVLFDFKGPTLTVELVPLSCPVRRSNATSRNQIAFGDCSPAQLVVSITPCGCLALGAACVR